MFLDHSVVSGAGPAIDLSSWIYNVCLIVKQGAG